MTDYAASLREKAEELRAIAALRPRFARELREIADELDRIADEIARDRPQP